VGEIELSGQRAAPRAGFERALRSAVGAAIAAERRQIRVRRVLAAAGSVAAGLVLGVVLWWVQTPAGRHTVPERSAPLVELWRYREAGAAQASEADRVVLHGTSMYVLRRQGSCGSVVAIDAATGRARWESRCDGLGYLASDGARVYCLVGRRRGGLALAALDARDGQVLWRYAQKGRRRLAAPTRPAPLRGDRVCWTAAGALHMLDARTGAAVWTRSLAREGLLSRVAARGAELLVASTRGLHGLDAASGEPSWAQGLGEGPAGPGRPLIAVSGDILYVVQPRLGVGGVLCCMDLVRREVVWRRRVPGARSLLAAADGVYVRGQKVVALDGRTGEPRWARPASGCGPLTHTDGLIHFVDSANRGHLVALEGRTGRTVWEVGGILSCGPFVKVGSTGYIKTQDGVVHAFALRERDRS
jgi:outer membrane protein assembly factor BamB